MAEVRMSVDDDKAEVTLPPRRSEAEVKDISIDLKDRDPLRMNDHVRVMFHEVIGEPHPEIYAFDSVWLTSHKVFTQTKLWCYRISTLLCSVPLAVLWGCQFALLACCTIWCYRPCQRAYAIQLTCIREFLKAALDSMYRPCFEACGYVFYNIRVKVGKVGSEVV